MTWKTIDTYVPSSEPVDIWVREDQSEKGGVRFPDMVFVKGSAGQRNDWDALDGMLTLSDCMYTCDDVTHRMPRPDAPGAAE